MTLYSVIFYALAALILVSTGFAITRRNLVHAVVYLIISFFGSAMLFYLLGAPLLAALEVIIYAGAIMVLFLFIIMMLNVEGFEEPFFPIRQWIPAVGMCLVFIAAGTLMIMGDPDSRIPLKAAVAE
ncbi:MAG: NADH-quinone oxidoreductase subunit J, partial [Deltaproteobacteria bacterium]|nr:NADH-quinone oxidoreductase subunit J [Deltaproteobacteria bacterium]